MYDATIQHVWPIGNSCRLPAAIAAGNSALGEPGEPLNCPASPSLPMTQASADCQLAPTSPAVSAFTTTDDLAGGTAIAMQALPGHWWS
jgi:hypothetical protein